MKRIVLTAVIACMLGAGLQAQSAPKDNLLLLAHGGMAMPNIESPNQAWKAGGQWLWGAGLAWERRLHRLWAVELGLGVQGYALRHRRSQEIYVLDFAAPEIWAGVIGFWGMDQTPSKSTAWLCRLQSGIQAGYPNTFTDVEADYLVEISPVAVIPWLRLAVGRRVTFTAKDRFTRIWGLGYGVQARVNPFGLGEATVLAAKDNALFRANGSGLGIWTSIQFPQGRQNVDTSKPAKAKAENRYCPRF